MNLTFELKVNSEKDEEYLIKLLKDRFPEASQIRGYLKVGVNVMSFSKNFDYAPEKCDDPDEGWQYYHYELSVFPVEASDLEFQDRFAKSLIDIFRAEGFQVQLVCGWEDI